MVFGCTIDILYQLHMMECYLNASYREQSIENWILPMVYAGHVSDILWIKPPWCDQLPDTSRLQFAVGKLVTTGVIRCDI